MAMTPIWWLQLIRVRLRSPILLTRYPRPITSGWATPLPLVVAMAMTTRAWVLLLVEPGSRCSDISGKSELTFKSRTLPWSVLAIWVAMSLAMACCYLSIFSWWQPLTICIFLLTPIQIRRQPLESASAFLRHLEPPGMTLINH